VGRGSASWWSRSVSQTRLCVNRMVNHIAGAARDVRQLSAVRDRSSGVSRAIPPTRQSSAFSISHKRAESDDIPATRRIHGSGKTEGNSTRSPSGEIASEGALLDAFELALIEATQFGILRCLRAIRDGKRISRVPGLLYEDLRQGNDVRVVVKGFSQIDHLVRSIYNVRGR
jgi:hypothetical protein